MTICMSALSTAGLGIVCIADKALSYGDHIQWDSDSSKMLKLNPSGSSVVMFAGSEEPTSKVLAALIAKADEFAEKSRPEIIAACESQYKQAMNELIEAKFLFPRLLSRQNYLDAITAHTVNSYIQSIANEVNSFVMDCDLLICGFDANGKAFILHVTHPGIATDMTMTGFHAIGSGWDKAVSRFLFSEHKREHLVERTLYDLFDAKANAEMAAGVGYEWDALVATGVSKIPYVDATKEIKDLIERAWAKFNRSPFDSYDRKEHVPPPPSNWQEQLWLLMNEPFTQKAHLQFWRKLIKLSGVYRAAAARLQPVLKAAVEKEGAFRNVKDKKTTQKIMIRQLTSQKSKRRQ